MKFGSTKFENHFDFKKKNEVIQEILPKINFKSELFYYFSKSISLISCISLISLFFFLNDISFQQQIKFIQQQYFSISFCVFAFIYHFIEVLKKYGPENFHGIWTPLKSVICIYSLIPITSDHLSLFSQLSISLIKTLEKLF